MARRARDAARPGRGTRAGAVGTELLRALGAAVELLLSENTEVRELAAQVEAQLRDLTA